MSKRAIIGWSAFGFLVLCYLVGSNSKANNALKTAKPEDMIGARTLTADYGNNEAAANKKRGEKILVFGEVFQVSSMGRSYTIELRGNLPGELVICMMSSDKGLDSLRRGAQVKVSGKFDKAIMGNVFIKNCAFELVE